MVIVLSGGYHSDDYWEHWYQRDQAITQQDLWKLMVEQAQEAGAIVERETQNKWDECEELFGIRTHPPSYGKLMPPKGTVEQIRLWEDKWEIRTSYERILMGLCGCERIKPEVEIDCGYEVDKNMVLAIGTKLQGT